MTEPSDDKVAAYLSEVRQRWATADSLTWQDYQTALEHLGAALRSVADVPRLLKAAEDALKIHYAHELYALSVLASDHSDQPKVWCGHTYDETDNDRHMAADDGSIICLDKPEATVCAECWEADGGEQVEWPCPTYSAITRALTGEQVTDG